MKEHSVDDMERIRLPTGVTLSPDGKRAAFVSSNVLKDYRGLIESRIVITSTESGNTEYAGDPGTSVSSPVFSPEGSRLAYIMASRELNYIVIRDVETGAEEKSMVEGKLSSLTWKDESVIIFAVEDYNSDEKKKAKEGNDGYFFEEAHKFTSLWRYKPGSGMSRITSGFQVWDFSVLGDRAVVVASDYPYNWSWYYGVIAVVDLNSGAKEILYRPEKRQLSSPRFSPDGKHVYFMESLMSDNGVESGDIIRITSEGKEPENITGNIEKTFSCFAFSRKGTMFALSSHMGTFEITDMSTGKGIWSASGSVFPIFSPKFAFNGESFVLAHASAKQRPEVFLIGMNGSSMQISRENDGLEDLVSYPSETVTWKAEDGREIYGIFRKAKDNAPLVVIVHGGPTSASVENFLDLSTVILGAGFSVFMPNYRGSTGKGRVYAELNRGDMGGKDFGDVMSGIDHIVGTRSVDGSRIYITGGSYGGFLSAWAVTQTDRFTASVSLFGISDWISFHGVASIGPWDSFHYDQDAYAFDRHVKFSAIRYVDSVKTPILLMHGIEDPFVPVGQYYQFYRALKEKGKETSLLLFPREGHGFREKKHYRMYISEMINYFNRFT